MVQIGDKLISEDIFSEEFVCNLTKCKGACCVEGDVGAPLEREETRILEEIFDKVKPYLRPEGVKALEEQGTWTVDPMDGDFVTPMVNGEECAYVIFDEKGITKCGNVVISTVLPVALPWRSGCSSVNIWRGQDGAQLFKLIAVVAAGIVLVVLSVNC